jgi:hypothetical protein
MRIIPSVKSERSVVLALRGCCEVEPPNLTSFKQSINNSLHESERTRCIEEILGAVFERVSRVCALRHRPGEDRIEGDVLVDDRAPVFEEANKKWSLKYSPGLYASLMVVAEQCWDALGITGFDRFWDLRVESLTEMAMKVRDGELKRALLCRINELLELGATSSSTANLTFSLAYVQLASCLEELPSLFMRDAASLSVTLPFFIVPKVQDPAELEEALESQRRKHRGSRRERKPPAKKSGRKGRIDEEASRAAILLHPEPTGEMSPRLKSAIRDTIRSDLKRKLLKFEDLAGESTGVAQQLTRVNEIEQLDTNLAREVDDDL